MGKILMLEKGQASRNQLSFLHTYSPSLPWEERWYSGVLHLALSPYNDRGCAAHFQEHQFLERRM